MKDVSGQVMEDGSIFDDSGKLFTGICISDSNCSKSTTERYTVENGKLTGPHVVYDSSGKIELIWMSPSAISGLNAYYYRYVNGQLQVARYIDCFGLHHGLSRHYRDNLLEAKFYYWHGVKVASFIICPTYDAQKTITNIIDPERYNDLLSQGFAPIW